MNIFKIIFITTFLFITSFAKAQTFIYSYTDPCTGLMKSMNVPVNGVTVTYFGQIQTFSPTDFQNGVFESWATNVYNSFGGGNPCGSIIGVSTAVDIAQGTVINFISVINNISALSDLQQSLAGPGGSLNTMSAIESAKSSSNKKDKKKDKSSNNGSSNSGQINGQNNNNNQTSGQTIQGNSQNTSGQNNGQTTGTNGQNNGQTTGTNNQTTNGSNRQTNDQSNGTSGQTTNGTTGQTNGQTTNVTNGSGQNGQTTNANGQTTGQTNGSNDQTSNGTNGTNGQTTNANGQTTGQTNGSNGQTTNGSNGQTTNANGQTTGQTNTNGSNGQTTNTNGQTTNANGSNGQTTNTNGQTTGQTNGSNDQTTNASNGQTTSANGQTTGQTNGSNGQNNGQSGNESNRANGQTNNQTNSSSEQTNSNQSNGETNSQNVDNNGNNTNNQQNSNSSQNINGNNSGNGNPPNNSENAAQNTEDKKTNFLGGTVNSTQRSTESNKPQIVLSSDFAGFNFKNNDVTFGGKGTGGFTSLSWDGRRSYGVLLDYTSVIRGPNLTAFYANLAKRRIDLISLTGTLSFYGRGSQYASLAVGQMWNLNKKKSLKAIYMATASFGNVYGERFLGTAFIAGGMYDWRVHKRVDIKMMNLFIYAPYVSYYNDILLKSPYVIMPIVGTNIGITKKFKFNINFGGAYAINENLMNFTLMFGTRFAL